MEARDYRQIARNNLQNNWGLSIGVAVIAYLLGGLLVGSSFIPSIEYKIEGQSISRFSDLLKVTLSTVGVTASFSSLLGLVQFIIGGVVELGYAQYLLKQYSRQDPQWNDLFSKFDYFGAGFCQKFLRSLYTFLWGLLFVIPGIVKSYAYAMTPFIMADNPNLTANEAITASREMMDGHKGDLFWLELTFIGWDLLAALTLNLGHLALNPYKNAARAAFYRELCRQRYEQAQY